MAKRTKLTTRLYNKYDRLIDNNFHSEVVYQIAKDFGIKDLEVVFKEIVDRHMQEGHLTEELSKLRRFYTTELISDLQDILSDEDFSRMRSLI